jgi:hypothetical protein
MPIIDPNLIQRARSAVEKRATPDMGQLAGPAVGALGGAALGGLLDRRHRLRGALLGGLGGAGLGLAAGQFGPAALAQAKQWGQVGNAPQPSGAEGWAQLMGRNPDDYGYKPMFEPPEYAPPGPVGDFPTPDPAGAKLATAIEKQAIIIPTLIGAGLGTGFAPRRNKFRGALRGAGVGLTTGIGMPLGGLLGAGAGGLGGAALGGLAGGGVSALSQLVARGEIDPQALAAHAGGGAALGGGLGMIGGSLGGTIVGGQEGFDFGKRHIWDRPWPGDREPPHGVAGGNDEDEDTGGRRKAASFAAGLGELAAQTRT